MLRNRSLVRVGILSTFPAFLSGYLLLCLFSSLAGANVLPEGQISVNIVSPGDPYYYCDTDITSCDQMVSSRPEQGLLEFQIFVDPKVNQHGNAPVPRLALDLSWPEAWTLVDGAYCRDGVPTDYWWFYGANPHHLELNWPCNPPNGVFVAISLVFDVQGYGVLDPTGDCRFWLGCPPNDYMVYPRAMFAEAGTGCAHPVDPCNDITPVCPPTFQDVVMHLAGVPGGSARGSLNFTAGASQWHYCSPSAYADAGWAHVRVLHGNQPWEFVLVVDADLTGLDPGIYTTDVHVNSNGTGRCVQAIVEVQYHPAAVESPTDTGPGSKALGLRLAGPNPSSSPFVWSYENRATAVVRCGIYDAAGREIATITQGEEQSRGHHTITWDGKDARGNRVQQGVYVMRLRANGESRSSRVIIVR